MDKICEVCKIKFQTYQKRQVFCSVSCGQKSRYSKVKTICAFCKVEFETCAGKCGRKFCSQSCFHKNNTHEKVPVTCKNCGRIAYFSPHVAKSRTNCSKECKYERLSKENSIRFQGIEGVDHASYKNGNTYYKKLAYKNLPAQCIACHREGIKFEVHHIDGNRGNNSLTNLCILCVSCHCHVHGISSKYSLSLEKSLEVMKITGHLPKHSYRSSEAQKKVEEAVRFVKTQSL